jgi:hypothetical protein
VNASKVSAIAGTAIGFPPGSIAISTNITIEEGAALASDSFNSEIGIDDSVTVSAAAPTVVIQSEVLMDAASPFTIAITVGSSLALQDVTNYAVLYNVYVAAQGKNVIGVIPTTDIAIKDGKVTFETIYFGAYQLVKTSAPIDQKKEIATERAIVTKTAALASIVVDDYKPFAPGTGQTVTLTGKNFRPTMTIALGTTKISNVNVMSDVSASFVMPTGVQYGFNDFTVTQDGTVDKGKLFARADLTGFPLITMDASGVCSGVTYYDGNGDKQVGTKDCSGGSDVMLKSVYDTNNDNKVDNAQVANSAASAASAASAVNASAASYATGQKGTNIASAATLNLPGDGSFYDVTGTTSVQGISSAPVGTRITLRFVSGLQLQNKFVSPKLRLRNLKNYAVPPGNMVEFVSLGGGDWEEIARSEFPNVIVAVEMNETGFDVNENTRWSRVDVNTWNTVLINSGTQYDVSTGLVTLSEAGTYTIEYGMSVPTFTINQVKPDCYMEIFKNGTSIDGFIPANLGSQPHSGCEGEKSTPPITLGALGTIKAKFGIGSFNGSAQTAKGQKTFMRIIKQ